MNQADENIVNTFRNLLPEDARRSLKKLIIFGSRARGEATPNSDLDLAAIVESRNTALEHALDDAAYEVMWAHDFNPMISLKVFDEKQFNDALNRGFSFYKHIEKDGIQA